MTLLAHGVQFADAHLTTGVRLRYAEAGERGRPAIVLLHGFTDSWFSFSQSLPALAEAYHVFALDQRGHGDSDRPAAGYAMADFAADALAFLDAQGLASATFVGHSMGTLVAQQAALDAPGQVERLVLIGATACARTPDVLELQREIDQLRDPVPWSFAHSFQSSQCHRPLPPDFLGRAVAESLKLPARVWQAAIAGVLAVDYTDRLGEIAAPTLLLHGEHDATFDLGHARRLQAGLRTASLKIYPDAGHSPNWEWPDEFTRDLAAFVGAGGAQ